MASRSEGPDKHLETRWREVTEEFEGLSGRERSDITDGYLDISRPLSAPDEPSTFNPLRARQGSLSRITAIIDEQHPDEQKLSRMKRMGKSFNRMTTFARKHPFLTAGIVVALLFFLATSFLTVTALTGHTTLAIFHAHPEIGAGIAFMTLYYGVYLVNMARRASIKDDLEKRIEAHNTFKDQLVDSRNVNVQEVVDEMNREIKVMSRKLFLAEREMRLAHDEVRVQYEKANAALERISIHQQQLITLLSKELTPEQEEDVRGALERCAPLIRQGAVHAFPELPTDLPRIPVMRVLSDSVVIPEHITDTMEENALKARSMGQKFKGLFVGIGQFTKQNPGSTVLIGTGLVMCVIGGVAASFWLHGATSMYFIGTLSAMTIAPMLIYGLSLMYEGYNSGTINDLKRKLREMDEADQSRKLALEDERARLDKIVEKTQGTFQQFTESWQEFHLIECEKHKLALQELRRKEVSQWHEAAGYCEAILKPLLRIYPDIDPVEARRVMTEPARGATLVGSTAHHGTPADPQTKFQTFV